MNRSLYGILKKMDFRVRCVRLRAKAILLEKGAEKLKLRDIPLQLSEEMLY